MGRRGAGCYSVNGASDGRQSVLEFVPRDKARVWQAGRGFP